MHKIFKNSGWLLIDKFARLFLGLLTTAMIARHIGPAAFGIWNFAIALTTIIGSLAILGLDKVVVKEVVSHPERQERIIASALAMRFVSGIISFLFCMIIVIVTKHNTPLYIYCTIVTAFTIILQSFDVFDYFYQAKNEVQRVIIPKVSVFILFCILKIVFIYLDGTLLSFLWLSFAELLITYLIILWYYLISTKTNLLIAISLTEMKQLFFHSWPLMFTGVLVLLYMKSDQLMLDTFGTPAQLGEYAAAARISELWYAIPTVIATAILPGLVEKRHTDIGAYHTAIERWLRLSCWISTMIAVCMSCAAPMLTRILYGAQYPQSGQILSIHIWANIPVFVGVVIMQYQIVEGKYKTNLYATVAGIIVNITANFLLIPLYGGTGAAISCVSSYITVISTLIILDSTGQVSIFLQRILHPGLVVADARHMFGAFKLFTDSSLSIIREKSLTK